MGRSGKGETRRWGEAETRRRGYGEAEKWKREKSMGDRLNSGKFAG
jgi:hypothetical protein